MVTLLPKTLPKAKQAKIETETLRGFPGGWNTIDDDDVNMSPRYMPVLKNFRRNRSGTQELRFGTRWFADIDSVSSGDGVDGTYFNGRLIVVTATGEIVSITDAGVTSVIWNESIANALSGSPSGWSATTQCDFVPFRNTLIVHNGVDKPVVITSGFAVSYLVDPTSGSNVNTPIGKYGCVVSNYHCIAGISGSPTTVYVSSAGTSTVFPGDAAPNDSISIDVGAYAPEGAESIRGIAGFRTYLIVFFRGQALIMQLGVYDGSDHEPTANDTMPHFGLLGHRCIASLENDLLFADYDGMNSAKRNLFSGLIESKHLSDIIAPSFQGQLTDKDDDDVLEQAFMVEDRLNRAVLIHFPNGSVHVRTADEQFKYEAWSEYTGWTWTWGCTSFLGRVFYGSGTRIYQLGNRAHGELYYADKQLDRDSTWATGTAYSLNAKVYDSVTEEVYTCGVAHTSPVSGTFADYREENPSVWTLYEGEVIPFDFELPWIDGRDPMQLKHLRFVNIASRGDAEFILEAYVDNKYKDVDDVVIYDPAVTVEFIGNQAVGFGGDAGPYGGGRRSGDPRLWRYPVRFKSVKFRIRGSTRRPLAISGLYFLFSRGRYRR